MRTRAHLRQAKVPRPSNAPIEHGDADAQLSIARSTPCRALMIGHRMRATYSHRLPKALTKKDKIDVRIVCSGE